MDKWVKIYLFIYLFIFFFFWRWEYNLDQTNGTFDCLRCLQIFI
ncbi:MAG: hypothetical protein N7Q72_06230 [Spiroplasma sp. Tabriz.8]|nr:hypothetical protein [Spiroplasma sp. Tabriz.8]